MVTGYVPLPLIHPQRWNYWKLHLPWPITQVYDTGNNCKSILPVRRMSVQQQRRSVDCGLFAVAFATESCQGRNPVNNSCDQDRMIEGSNASPSLQLFQHGEISAFPFIHCRVHWDSSPPKVQTLPILFTAIVECLMSMTRTWFGVMSADSGYTIHVLALLTPRWIVHSAVVCARA